MLCLVFSPSPLVLLFGEVAEWFNAPDSKSDVLSQVPGVRIPLSPLLKIGLGGFNLQGFFITQRFSACIVSNFGKDQHPT